MKKLLASALVLPALLCAGEVAESTVLEKLSFQPRGGVVIQAQKDLFSNGSKDNLDQWFGRLDFGATMKLGSSRLDFDLRFFPEGFGHDVRGPGMATRDVWYYYTRPTWITLPGNTETGAPIRVPGEPIRDSIRIGSEEYLERDTHLFSIERVQIRKAVFTNEGRFGTVRLGRDLIWRTQGLVFGNYIDESVGGGFLGKGIYANFLEMEKSFDMLTAFLMLEANSPELNKGNLRTWFDLDLVENLSLGLGYKSNVFDLIYDSDVDVVHAIAFNTAFVLPSDMTLFAEMGVRDLHEDLDTYVPVLVGARYPLAGPVQFVQVEAEALKTGDRERLTGVKDSPLLYGISTAVSVTDNITFDVGIHSSRDIEKSTIAVQFTGKF